MLLHDTSESQTVGVPADYVDGDPVEPGPITGGTLTLDSSGLLFRGRTGQGQVRIDVDELEGMTVTGARPRSAPETKLRGSARVAAYRDDVPTVFEFAVDRSKAAMLRDRLNRLLAGLGRDPLPFVEALYEFETPVPAPVPVDIDPETNGDGETTVIPRIRRRTPKKPAKIYRPHDRQRLIIFGVIATIVCLEVAVTLLVLFVF